MFRTPFLSTGLLAVVLGILILIYPNLLEFIVAFFLISFGVSLLTIHTAVRRGTSTWYRL